MFPCSVEEKYSVTNDASLDDNTSTTPTETDNNVGLEDFSSCTYCFKGFTEAGIYSCKRDHHICVNCRLKKINLFVLSLTCKWRFIYKFVLKAFYDIKSDGFNQINFLIPNNAILYDKLWLLQLNNFRMVIPGCICPVCYHEFGDRKRLALDHEANVKMR